jgi:transposase-like protein
MSDLPVLPSAHSRRRRTTAEKLQIVQESLVPSVLMAAVALAHRINANQLHKCRWQYRNGELGKLDSCLTTRTRNKGFTARATQRSTELIGGQP